MSIRKGGNLILEDSIHPARIADSFATIIIQGIHKLMNSCESQLVTTFSFWMLFFLVYFLICFDFQI